MMSIKREMAKMNTVKAVDTVRAEVMRSPSKYFEISYQLPCFSLER